MKITHVFEWTCLVGGSGSDGLTSPRRPRFAGAFR